MSGCRHPYLPGKHVKHVAFDHPHAVWFLQMDTNGIPCKKVGLRWSVYIDGEIPTWMVNSHLQHLKKLGFELGL